MTPTELAIARIEGVLRRRPRILVIDDEPQCIELFKLVARGCDITAAHSSDEGLVLLGADPDYFDAIVVDENLKKKPGHQVIKEIRENWTETVLTAWTTDLMSITPEIARAVTDLDLILTLPKPVRARGIRMLLQFIEEKRRRVK